MMISPLYLFSYWIYAWFLLWILFGHGAVSWSPWLAILIATLENVASFIWLILKRANKIILYQYIFMIFLIKLIPLWLVWPHHLGNFPWKMNALFCVSIFICYWIVVQSISHQSPIQIYKNTMSSIVKGSNETPMFYVLSKYFYALKT